MTLRVLAAASLAGPFEAIAQAFHRDHPSVEVTVDYGGSTAQAQAILNGAPADVIAVADSRSLDGLVTTGRIAPDPPVFAANQLAIAVAHGNPKQVRGLADLARPGLAVALCAAEVPCGRLAGEALAKAGATVTPRTRESDVTAVVSKVALGEVDAGVVYVTDVRAGAPKIEGVTIPAGQNVIARYPAAVVRARHHSREAAEFVAFLRSPAAQALLRRAGFTSP
jgi:molybdate transport system substrate-binding protein